MKVPCRVLKGQGGGQGAYYWDGVNPMTVLGGGIGAILVDNGGFDLPTVTLAPANFDLLQDYLLNRLRAFAAIAACETCPTETATTVLDNLAVEDGGAAA